MSILNYLQFQAIDSDLDDLPESHRVQDEFDLNERIDEQNLEEFWDKVINDIHNDPSWFKFADE